MDEEAVINSIESLTLRRYPTLLVLQGKSHSYSPQSILNIGKRCHLDCIDFEAQMVRKDTSPLHIWDFPRGHFSEWLLDEARKRKGIIVFHIGTMVATWNDEDRTHFFKNFLKSEVKVDAVKVPIVLFCEKSVTGVYRKSSDVEGLGLIIDLDQQDDGGE